MITGVCFRAYPGEGQKLKLSQWMGCARVIWNAKCDEHRYYQIFARKYCPVGTYAPIDQTYSQFKSDLTPWLSDCPSAIYGAVCFNWKHTYQKFMKGICGRPKIKKKSDKGSILLTKNLFHIKDFGNGDFRLFVGLKSNNIGYLKFKAHREFGQPKSVTVRKEAGKYYVSFCYELDDAEPVPEKETLKYLKDSSDRYLQKYVVGLDRGIAIPVQVGNNGYDFSQVNKRKMQKAETYHKRFQRKLARQVKGSNRRSKTKIRINNQYKKTSNIRKDFLHKTSRKIVDSEYKVFVFENLKTINMTKKPKAKQDENGKFLPNKAKAKAGLNKNILNVGWFNMETYVRYKAQRLGKVSFKVSPHFTSQECAKCSHTHPDNRKKQDVFKCVNCGHIDNADRNAAMVIKSRAIGLIKDTGTVLVGKGMPLLTTGRGANGKPLKGKPDNARSLEASKKMRLPIKKLVRKTLKHAREGPDSVAVGET